MCHIVVYGREISDDPARKSAHIINEDSSKVSILFPIPYSGSEKDIANYLRLFKRVIETTLKIWK